MIILKIPKRKEHREFILNNIKKLRRNMKRKSIKLQGEVAYSSSHVYFVFPSRGLELAFALSILIKCQRKNIPCQLELSKELDLANLPEEVREAATTWAEGKLRRMHYRLRDLKL
jgi:hypothetical protein